MSFFLYSLNDMMTLNNADNDDDEGEDGEDNEEAWSVLSIWIYLRIYISDLLHS